MAGQEPAKRKRLPGRLLKIILIAAAAALLLAALVLSILPLLISNSAVERAISRQTQQALGRPARLGDSSISLFGGLHITLSDLVIEDLPQFGDRPLVRIERLKMSAALLSLLSGKPAVTSLVIDNPELSVVRRADGELNLSKLPQPDTRPDDTQPPEQKKPAESPAFSIAGMKLNNATIHFLNMATGETSRISNVNAQLAAEAQPADGRARLTQADVTADGFSFSASGELARSGGSPMLNATAECAADLTKLGRQMSPVLPVSIEGNAAWELVASGPLKSVSVRSRTQLGGVRATGAILRKPAVIQDLLIEQQSLVNIRSRSITDFSTTIVSDSLGIEAEATGSIADAVAFSGIAGKLACTLDLARLTELTAAFTAQPVEASGEVAFDAGLSGDLPALQEAAVLPAGGEPKRLRASGRLRATDIRLQNPRLAEPYVDDRVDLDYDVIVEELPRLVINRFDLVSGLAAAEASGTVSPDSADLEASVRGDLASACTVLSGLGIVREGMAVEGRYTGHLKASTAQNNVQVTASGTVRDLVFCLTRDGGRVREPMVTVNSRAVVSIDGGLPDSVKELVVEVASESVALNASLAAEHLTTKPVFEGRLLAKSFKIERVRQVLLDLGLVEEIEELQGVAQADITIAGAARRPLLHAPQTQAENAQIVAQNAAAAPLITLADLRATLAVAAERIIYDKLAIGKASIVASLAESVLKADGRAEMYGGTLAFTNETNLRPAEPTHSLRLNARKVTLTRALWEFINDVVPFFPLPLGRVEGVFDSDMQFDARGLDQRTLISGLNGSGTITMPDDVRVTVAVFRGMPGLGDYSDLEFGRMNSALQVADGVTTSDTTFTAPDLIMKLTGTTDLKVQNVPGIDTPGRPIDYRISLKGDRVGRDLRRLLNKEGVLPVAITGTLDNPRAKLQLEGILGPLEELFR